MMYNTKLNEFEPEQLDLFLSMVTDKVVDITYHWSRVSKWEDGELKRHKEDRLKWQFDSITLLKVQLENAKKDIEERNKINAG